VESRKKEINCRDFKTALTRVFFHRQIYIFFLKSMQEGIQKEIAALYL
jgi:hypothetical protein